MADVGRIRGQAGFLPARGRSWPWPPSLPWSDLSHAVAGKFRGWALAEAAPGRLMPWLPVAFGTGVVIYFAVPQEPVWWAGLALASGCGGLALAFRAHAIAFAVMLWLAAAC